MNTRNLLLLACCALLLLAGCSTTRLAYDHLDTFLRWQATDYVDLTPAQKRNLDAEIRSWWAWHRSTQLPLYAVELRRLAAEAQAGPVTRARLEALGDTIEGWWIATATQAAPGFARLNAELDDAQIAGEVRRIGKEADRRASKRLRHGDEDRRREAAEEMDDRLEQWLGSTSAAQEALVRQWAAGLRLTSAAQFQQRRAQLDQYAALLAGRAQPGFERRMRDYLVTNHDDAELRAQEREERLRWFQLLADMSGTLSAEQRQHLVRRLIGFAEDFEALAAEAPAAVPAGNT